MSFLFQNSSFYIIGDENGDQEQCVRRDAANRLYDLTFQRLGVVHHRCEAIVTIERDEESGCDQLRDGDEDTGEQSTADGLHDGESIVEDCHKNKYTPNDDCMEAKVDQLDVIRHADQNRNAGEDQGSHQKLPGFDGLICDNEETDCAAGCLQRVAEYDIGQNEHKVLHRGKRSFRIELYSLIDLSLVQTALTV